MPHVPSHTRNWCQPMTKPAFKHWVHAMQAGSSNLSATLCMSASTAAHASTSCPQKRVVPGLLLYTSVLQRCTPLCLVCASTMCTYVVQSKPMSPSLLHNILVLFRDGRAISASKRGGVEVFVGELHASHILLLCHHQLAKRQKRVLHSSHCVEGISYACITAC
jgi:hypothetical protein